MRVKTRTEVSDYVDVHPVNGYEIVHDVSKGDITNVIIQPVFLQDKKEIIKDSARVPSPTFPTKLHFTVEYYKEEVV